ncbi:MAG TPA: UDP-N-acetylmuramate--L-alanine ligase [Coriobacteriia bacterium]|nr:UDP-N-acetylmuramate--L-alanine ligase [Coriobacteriia bacterium]
MYFDKGAVLSQIKKVHFIGIGGSGMSGIALAAHEVGIEVTGSDLKETRYMRALHRAGVSVIVGHEPCNVMDEDIDVVVVSTAIPETNPEYQAAMERGLEIWPRARMLAYLSRGFKTLAVAGTHGKTTTSSMLATALDRLGADPTFMIGGVVDGYDSNARTGKGEYFVVEADESDGSFTWLSPSLALITNIEVDHIDHYGGLDEIVSSFRSFLEQVDEDGIVVVWADSPGLLELAKASGRRVCTYGTGENADVRLEPKGVSDFDVVFADGRKSSLVLCVSPGLHNKLNATGVMAALDILGFDREASARAVSAYQGVRRRFDRIGVSQGVTVIDDYGHHPTEVAATLKAASELGYNKIHVLFQPHRYSRTQVFLDDFASAFECADTVSIMEIYSAGEAPIPGVNGQALSDAIAQKSADKTVQFIKHRQDTVEAMAGLAKDGDMIITMGAGDVTVLAPMILELLKQGDPETPADPDTAEKGEVTTSVANNGGTA